MKYIQTTLKTYNDFFNENNTNLLSKKLKLHVTKIPKYLKLDEIFDTDLNLVENVDFEVIEYPHQKYNEKNYIYYFKLKDVDYRIDFVIIKEDNEKLKNKKLHDKKFISISFSLKSTNEDDYDIPTELNNQYQVMNYIIYLVNHFKLNKIKSNYIFMFGDPIDTRKVNIYEFIVKQCFPDYKIKKDYTSGFPNTKIGYYLIKD